MNTYTYVRMCTYTYRHVNGGICIGRHVSSAALSWTTWRRAVANRSCCMLYTPRVVHSQGLSPGSSRTAKGIRHVSWANPLAKNHKGDTEVEVDSVEAST